MSKIIARKSLNAILFACLLLLPSLDVPLKYLGINGAIAYVVLGLIGLYVYIELIASKLVASLGERTSVLMLLIIFVLLIVVAAVGYPLANSGRFGGGSDMDDALILGATELVNGRYPYYPRTYLGGLLSPMPGAIILSVPFVIVNLLPYQNIFWLGALALAVKKYLGKFSYALLAVSTVLLVSPTIYQVIVTGSDHATNAIYVLVGLWILVKSGNGDSNVRYANIFAAIFVGLGLSSRSNFLQLMPLLFSVLVQTSGWKTAIRSCVIVSLSFLVVTLPFWLYDPSGFAPFTVQASKLEALSTVLPGAAMIISISSLLLACGLALTKMKSDCAAFFRNCAIVQLFALYFPSLLFCIRESHFTLFMGNVGYGMFTLFFAIVSLWIYRSTANSEELTPSLSRELPHLASFVDS